MNLSWDYFLKAPPTICEGGCRGRRKMYTKTWERIKMSLRRKANNKKQIPFSFTFLIAALFCALPCKFFSPRRRPEETIFGVFYVELSFINWVHINVFNKLFWRWQKGCDLSRLDTIFAFTQQPTKSIKSMSINS